MGAKGEAKREANLIPFNSETAKIKGKKGGQSTSDRKTMAVRINARKWCKPECPLYPCPFYPLVKELKGKCALKQMPERLQDRTLRLFLDGREGAVKEMTNILIELSRDVETINEDHDTNECMKAKALYFDKVKNFIETAHGREIRQEIRGDVKITTSIENKFLDEIGKILQETADEPKLDKDNKEDGE